jgi:hypothetical protein
VRLGMPAGSAGPPAAPLARGSFGLTEQWSFRPGWMLHLYRDRELFRKVRFVAENADDERYPS